MISSSAGELAFWTAPDQIWLRTVCKVVTAAAVLLCAFVCRKQKEEGFWWIFFALLFAGIGDIVIVFSFLAGAGMFALAHIFLIILFLRRNPLSRKSWIIWGVISAVLAAVVLIVGREKGFYAYGAAAYAPILLLMVFAAKGQRGMLRTGACIFFVSDLLLALYQWKHIHGSLHVIYMALFYIALVMFAIAEVKKKEEI